MYGYIIYGYIWIYGHTIYGYVWTYILFAHSISGCLSYFCFLISFLNNAVVNMGMIA